MNDRVAVTGEGDVGDVGPGLAPEEEEVARGDAIERDRRARLRLLR